MLKLALVVLPRWFGSPIIIASVVLGYVVSEELSLNVIYPILSALFMMAYAHCGNTLLDWSWTGLDKGEPDERSKPKPYTSGQQAIASGAMTPQQVGIVALCWLALSAWFMFVTVVVSDSLWVVPIWFASVFITAWYSWGKLHWMPEVALGVGFGPLAALLGAAATQDPNWLHAVLASLPIALIFGGAAEIYDQWFDAEANWDRGLRNIGAWVWKRNIPVKNIVALFVMLTFLAQGILVAVDVLSSMTILTVPAALSLFVIGYAQKRKPWAVNLLLGGVFYYCVALAVGQVIRP